MKTPEELYSEHQQASSDLESAKSRYHNNLEESSRIAQEFIEQASQEFQAHLKNQISEALKTGRLDLVESLLVDLKRQAASDKILVANGEKDEFENKMVQFSSLLVNKRSDIATQCRKLLRNESNSIVNEADVKDIVSEIISKLFIYGKNHPEDVERFLQEDNTSFDAWVWVTTKNTLTDYFRRKRTDPLSRRLEMAEGGINRSAPSGDVNMEIHPNLIETDVEDRILQNIEDEPKYALMSADERSRLLNIKNESLQEAIGALKPKFRDVILLSLEGYDGYEIADKLGYRTIDAVHQVMTRARNDMRKHLGLNQSDQEEDLKGAA